MWRVREQVCYQIHCFLQSSRKVDVNIDVDVDDDDGNVSENL